MSWLLTEGLKLSDGEAESAVRSVLVAPRPWRYRSSWRWQIRRLPVAAAVMATVGECWASSR